jgi:hypothetical protein
VGVEVKAADVLALGGSHRAENPAQRNGIHERYALEEFRKLIPVLGLEATLDVKHRRAL